MIATMNPKLNLLLLVLFTASIMSCQKDADPRVSGDPCGVTGTVMFVDNFGGYKIKVDNADQYVQPLVAQSAHCPIFEEMFVEEGMRVKFSYRDLEHKIEGNAAAGIPEADAVTLLCLTGESDPIPTHTHH